MPNLKNGSFIGGDRGLLLSRPTSENGGVYNINAFFEKPGQVPFTETQGTLASDFYLPGPQEVLTNYYSYTTSPMCMFLDYSGTKLFFNIITTTDILKTATLSTPYDISTTTGIVTTNTLDAEIETGSSIWLSSDGTKFFMSNSTSTGTRGLGIHQYNLSTPWDISSASRTYTASAVTTFAVDSFAFSPDGTKIIKKIAGGAIRIWELSTAWDLTSIGASTTYTPATSITSIAVSPDGTRILGCAGSSIYSYVMSTPWDLSTITAHGPFSLDFRSLGMITGSGGYVNLFAALDGSGFYVSNSGTYDYTVFFSGMDVENWLTSPSASADISAATWVGAAITPDGKKIIAYYSDRLYSHESTVAWSPSDFSTLATPGSPITTDVEDGFGMSTDGVYFVVHGTSGDLIQLHNFNARADESDFSLVIGQGISTTVAAGGIFISPEGTKIIRGTTTADGIQKWTLNDGAYQLGGSVTSSSTDVDTRLPGVPTVVGTAYSPIYDYSGRFLFLNGTDNDMVACYYLPTAYDTTGVWEYRGIIDTGSLTTSQVVGGMILPDGSGIFLMFSNGMIARWDF